jgi:tRNA-dihydrouridine synthase B
LIAPFDLSVRRFCLAPIAGWSDAPFRAIAKRFGADLTISEMISANALVCNRKKTKKLYEKSAIETPYSVQLVGSDVAIISEAVKILNDEDIDIIDLNAGCPAPKIARGGGGSALLKDPRLLGAIVAAIKKTSKKPTTSVKIRLGFDRNNGVEIAKVCEDSGADFITIHGRTKTGGFTSTVDYEAIGEIKSKLKIPVIANGDIDSYAKARSVFNATNADGVMIARAALGAPWIFAELKDQSAIDRTAKCAAIIEHFDSAIAFYGAYGAIIFRKHLHRYSKFYEGAAAFRVLINKTSDIAQTRDMIESFFKG